MIRQNQKILIYLQRICDLLIMFISVRIAFELRFQSYEGNYLNLPFYLIGAIILMPLYSWVCTFCNLYKQYRAADFVKEFIRIIEATVIITIICLAIVTILKITNVSRLVIVIFMIVNILLLSLFRFSERIILRKIRAKGYNVKYILLIGRDEILKEISNKLKEKDEYGYAVTVYRGKIENLWRYLENNLIDEIFVSVENNDVLECVYNTSEKYGIKINIVPSYSKFLANKIYVDEFIGIPIINIRDIPLENIFNRGLKRLFDIMISFIALIVLIPVIVVTAIIIKLTSKGPLIYKQRRVGMNRRSFYMYKFRSMNVDESFKENIKGSEVNRCTRFGRFIRKYKIDEIPQFFNVLKGDMSIVGPRPEITTLVKRYKDEIPNYMLKHRVKCGMTGLAQIKGFMGDTSLKKRIELDNEYINNWSIWLDLKILFLTVPCILKNRK